MAINISIDSKLIERALEVSGERTKKVWDGDGSSGDWGEGLNALSCSQNGSMLEFLYVDYRAGHVTRVLAEARRCRDSAALVVRGGQSGRLAQPGGRQGRLPERKLHCE